MAAAEVVGHEGGVAFVYGGGPRLHGTVPVTVQLSSSGTTMFMNSVDVVCESMRPSHQLGGSFTKAFVSTETTSWGVPALSGVAALLIVHSFAGTPETASISAMRVVCIGNAPEDVPSTSDSGSLGSVIPEGALASATSYFLSTAP